MLQYITCWLCQQGNNKAVSTKKQKLPSIPDISISHSTFICTTPNHNIEKKKWQPDFICEKQSHVVSPSWLDTIDIQVDAPALPLSAVSLGLHTLTHFSDSVQTTSLNATWQTFLCAYLHIAVSPPPKNMFFFLLFFCCTRASRQLMNETCRRREPEGGKKLTGGDEEKGSTTSSVRRAIGSPSFSEKGPLVLMHTSAVTSRLSSADAFYEVVPQFIIYILRCFVAAAAETVNFHAAQIVWNVKCETGQ